MEKCATLCMLCLWPWAVVRKVYQSDLGHVLPTPRVQHPLHQGKVGKVWQNQAFPSLAPRVTNEYFLLQVGRGAKYKYTSFHWSRPEAQVMDILKGKNRLIHGGNMVLLQQPVPFKYQHFLPMSQSPAPMALTNPSTQHKKWKLQSVHCSYPGQDDNRGKPRGIP